MLNITDMRRSCTDGGRLHSVTLMALLTPAALLSGIAKSVVELNVLDTVNRNCIAHDVRVPADPPNSNLQAMSATASLQVPLNAPTGCASRAPNPAPVDG